MQKFTRFLLLISFLSIGYVELEASHLVASEITTECINACTTRVTFRAYRDCTGASGISNNITWDPITPGCATPTAVTNWSAQITTEVTPICPSTPTACSVPGSIINGVEEYYWWRDYDICSQPNCEFNLVWTTCCRNPIITSLQNPGSQAMYNGANYFNTGVTPCNNSPVYTTLPLFYACQGQNYNVHQGAFDPDGDSLVYSLGPCYTNNNTQPVTYATGFSSTQPLGPSWNVSLDPLTGILNLQANPGNIEVGVVCIYVDEYRNGTLIGTWVRDIQIVILACAANTNPTITGYTNLSPNVTNSGDDFYVCGGGQVCFDINTSDPDAGQTLTLYGSHASVGASFVDVTNANVTDTIIASQATPPAGRFCWTPSASGVYQFIYTVEDNSCPIFGFEDRIITIHVNNTPTTSAAASVTGCLDVNFTASACGGSGNYTYVWSGGGGLTGNTSNFNFTYSTGGTYNWQVIISDGGVINDTIQGTVTIGGQSYLPLISPSGTVSICSNQSALLAVGSGYTSYAWSNGGTTSSITVNTPGTYHVTVTHPQGCTFFDSVNVINTPPQYQQTITGNTTLDPCNGSATTTLDAGSGWFWYTWSTGATTQTISVNQPGTYGVTVQDANGCDFYDSVYVNLITPEMYGIINTSTNLPLQNQKVYLIKFDAVLQALSAVDSTFTDNTGYYQFCNLNDTILFVKAAPDSAAYPWEMPTYADSSLFWNQATPYLGLFNLSYQVNFNTLYGQNPGGPGFIGGLVSQGANKTTGVGDPVANVHLFLVNNTTGDVLDHTTTDANGYFSFANIPYGTYDIVPDHPYVDETNPPNLSISAQNPIRDSLDFRLHSTYLELVLGTDVEVPAVSSFGFEAAPNPFSGSTEIRLEIEERKDLSLKVFDLVGAEVAVLAEGEYEAGKYRFDFSASDLGLPAGIYIARLQSGSEQHTIKLLDLTGK